MHIILVIIFKWLSLYDFMKNKIFTYFTIQIQVLTLFHTLMQTVTSQYTLLTRVLVVQIKLSVPKARKILTFYLAQPSLKKSDISKINIPKAKINYCHILKRGNLRVIYLGNPNVLPVLNYYVIAPCKCSRLLA